MTDKEFREMCEKHDLTYSYSDDNHVWRRGKASYDAIQTAAKNVPNAEKIWNEVAKEKLGDNWTIFKW